ncbi:MAG: hypothetical protein OXI27_06140 [Thaumarchaeota archaeon]|nr:hypothetical protein [Nitrososphaerota archaeon]
MNRGVLIDYQLAGWSIENEPQIRKNYSDIHRVGKPNVLADDSTDSELASFCLERGCDLMTCDKEAYAPMLKKRGVKFVQIHEYDMNEKSGQQIYVIKPVTS